jgi:bacillithiol biosynthesis cysteine-adding enzyme BshC
VSAPPLPLSAHTRVFRTAGGEALLEPLRWVSTVEQVGPLAPAPDRRALASGLAVANASYGHPRARVLAEKLADPATTVVVTGQQPGLFGGPLYTLVKALAAVRWARNLESAGRPAVAVFWMATEDHDWTEVARAAWRTSSGTREANLGEDTAELRPVGLRTLGPGLERVRAAVLESLGSPDAAERFDDLTRESRVDARFGEAFARLYCRLLGDDAPLLLDAQLSELKAAERPWMRRLVERRHELKEAISSAEALLGARGLDPQVRPQPGAGQLFVLRSGDGGPERVRVVWEGRDGYSLRGSQEVHPVAQLLDTIDSNPSVVSPGVLSRQAIQDAVLGSGLMILGPGEMAYTAQSRATYKVLGVPGTPVARRPQAIFVEPNLLRKGADWIEALPALLGADFRPDRWLGERGGSNGLEALETARGQVERLLEDLRNPAAEVDSQLVKAWERTREGVLRSFETFGERWKASLGRRDEAELQRWTKLRDYVAPDGVPHERVWTVGPSAARWGPAWLGALRSSLSTDAEAWHVIRWEDAP